MSGVRILFGLVNPNSLNVFKPKQLAYQKRTVTQLHYTRLWSTCPCSSAAPTFPHDAQHRRHFQHSSPSNSSRQFRTCPTLLKHHKKTSPQIHRTNSNSNNSSRQFSTCPALLKHHKKTSHPIHRINTDHRGSIRPGNRPDSDFSFHGEEDVEDPTALLSDADYSMLLHNAHGFEAGVVGRANLKGGVYVILPWIKWGPLQKTATTSDLLLQEACALVSSLKDVVVLGKSVVKVSHENKTIVMGPGQTLTLSITMKDIPGLSAVFVSIERMPLWQIRSLEMEFGVRVVDRYWVVLAIFHQHARTMEAHMQIALAELPYIKSRTRHDNERAIIDRRMHRLQRELVKLRTRREQVRKTRAAFSRPSVAVVGYTNSGKTSIISALCDDASVQGQDQLFATLDVTAHGVAFPCGLRGVLMDTVGFVQDLPTQLIACFNATLRDAAAADVILHVRDLSHPDRLAHHITVMQALATINVSPSTPIITVDNKADLIDHSTLALQLEDKIMMRQLVPARTSSTTTSKNCVSYLMHPCSSTPTDTQFNDDFSGSSSKAALHVEEEEETSVSKMARHERLEKYKKNYNATPSLIVSAKTKQGLLTTMEALEEQVLRVTNTRMCRMKLPTGGEHIRILRRIAGFAKETIVADCPEKTEVVCALTDQQLAEFKKSCRELTARN